MSHTIKIFNLLIGFSLGPNNFIGYNLPKLFQYCNYKILRTIIQS
jgi:hypothetical protein